jgi:CubicO group peptidase (beta-lactamase class C family)
MKRFKGDRIRLRLVLVVLVGAVVAGCGGGGSSDGPRIIAASCSPAQVSQLEAVMDDTLSRVESDVDFSFAVERSDGRRYVFNRGASTMQTSYQSASMSKMIAVVIILRQVELGVLSLDSRAQDLIRTWPISGSDPLAGMTLAQLLSLTSGLSIDVSCMDSATANFETCVNTIASSNIRNGFAAGQQFSYADAHHQVAALMAVKARGMAGWQDLFAEFKTQTGLFPNTTFDIPSASNPRIAGGMQITAGDYMDFLAALKSGALLNASSMSDMLADHIGSLPIKFSPIFSGLNGGPGLGEDWHYGFGLWQECQSTEYNCIPGSRVSSPGHFGGYPFWDRDKAYTGIVMRQGTSDTLINGINIERSVRPDVERWAAACLSSGA